jgi:hypothetical protein
VAIKLNSATIYFPNSEEHVEVGHPANNGQVISEITATINLSQTFVAVLTKINGKDEVIEQYLSPNVKLSYIHEEEK